MIAAIQALPNGVAALRPLHSSDIPAALYLGWQEGWNQTETDWARFLSLPPRRAIAISVNGALVATATTALFGPVGWVGMVVVAPNFRGQGLGRAIVWSAVQALWEAGARTVKLDATPLGQPLYARLGFTATFKLHRYRGVATPQPFEGVTPIGAEPELFARACALDRLAYGVDRSALLRALAADFPSLAAYCEAPSAGCGYVLGRHGRRFCLIGPLVATTPRVARNLLAWAFSSLSGQAVAFDCPEPNAEANGLALELGLEPTRSFTRMYLGQEPYSEDTGLIYATSGAEKG